MLLFLDVGFGFDFDFAVDFVQMPTEEDKRTRTRCFASLIFSGGGGKRGGGRGKNNRVSGREARTALEQELPIGTKRSRASAGAERNLGFFFLQSRTAISIGFT